MDFIVHKPF